MAALMIGPEQTKAIREAVARARLKPIPWEVLEPMGIAPKATRVTLEDRRVALWMRPKAEEVLIPVDFRLCVSFEHQPAGLLAHLSISIDRKGRVPDEPALEMILVAAGFPPPADQMWLEDFTIDGKPGGVAVNFVFMVEPATMN